MTSNDLRIDRASEWPLESMISVWNKAFTSHQTTVSRFSRMVHAGPHGRTGTVFLAWHRQTLAGWSLMGRGSKGGMIDVLAVRPDLESAEVNVAYALVSGALVWFKDEKLSDIFLNSHPEPVDAGQGFERVGDSLEIKATSDEYRLSPRSVRTPGVEIRSWRPGDDRSMTDFFERHKRDWTDRAVYDPKRVFSDGNSGMFVAVSRGNIVGYSRCVTDAELKDCSEVAWIWAAAAPQSPRGHLSRLIVDERMRGRGIGSALAAKAIGYLFDKNCREIHIVARNDEPTQRFYGRFGFQKADRFLKWKRSVRDQRSFPNIKSFNLTARALQCVRYIGNPLSRPA